MQTMPPQPFSLYINIIITVLSLYAAWVNLVQKRISNFGFDAVLLAIGSLWDARQARKVRKDPKLIQRMGVIMLLFGIGGVYAVITRFFELFR
jgi:hypothetical protein